MKAQLYGTGALVRKPKRHRQTHATATLTLAGVRSCELSTLRHSWIGRGALHFHEGRVKRSTAAHVREPRRGQHINVDAALRELRPAQSSANHSALHRAIDARTQKDLAPLIEDAHPVAIHYPARLCIFICNFQVVLMRFHLLMRGQVDEG